MKTALKIAQKSDISSVTRLLTLLEAYEEELYSLTLRDYEAIEAQLEEENDGVNLKDPIALKEALQVL